MGLISKSFQAPTGGWVTNKSIGGMAPSEALILDNYFPDADTVDLIKGFAQHATGIGSGAVETLMVWNGLTSSKLLAAGNNAIYNATSAGAASSLASGYSNNRWQWVNFETAGGNFVVAVNGADAPINYNGTAIATIPAITGAGLTASNLIGINVFKNRIFLIEKNTLNFWYLPVSSIGGVASKFPLGQWCSRGGYLVAMGTWSRDGGDGMDDLAVFLTSEGEALVYQGSDPSTAADWALVGVFLVGQPIGRRCMVKYANDLILITQNGFVPLSKVLSLGSSAASAIAISAQIEPTVTAAVQAYSSNFGWEGCIYPRGGRIIFNIPQTENTLVEQYVVNAQTGAWCRYSDHNANCWAVMGQRLYFGGIDGKVHLADEGQDFNGSGIQGDIATSFQYLGSPKEKIFQSVRPVIFSSGNITLSYKVNTDFSTKIPSFGTTATFSGTPWGSPWGSVWSSEQTLFQKWLSCGANGRCASFRMRTNTTGTSISLSAIDWIAQTGGLM